MTPLSRENKFRFACPVFGAVVTLAGCARLHELHQVDAPVEGRRGCRACMASERCPMLGVVREMRMNVEPGRYVSDDPTPGDLEPDTLARTHRTLVRDAHLALYDPTPGERALIAASNARAADFEPAAPAVPTKRTKRKPQ